MVVRFAPSPTGALHAGGARTALFNYLFRVRHGGSLILRIEDTDRERNVAGSEGQLLTDLRWLGIEFDESDAIGGENSPYRQSARAARHIEAAEKLVECGAAYRCCCSAERLDEVRRLAQAEGRPPRYDRHCLHTSPEEHSRMLEPDVATVIRLLTPDDRTLDIPDLFRGIVSFEGKHLDDPILVRSDGSPTTLLAGVVDDFEMGMTHILRGEEWLASTPYQYLIFEALGARLPVWGHLSLLLGEDGTKLSKRTPGLRIHEMREQGILPEAINRYLFGLGRATLGEDQGWTMESLAEGFDPSDHRAGGTVFSLAALRAESGRLIRRLSVLELRQRLEAASPEGIFPPLWDEQKSNRAVELAAEAAETMVDLGREIERFTLPSDPAGLNWAETAHAVEVLQAVKETFQRLESWEEPAINDAIKEVGRASGTKGRDLFVPIRLAVTGAAHGPKIAAIVALIGREEFLNRIEAAIKHLLTTQA